MYIKKLPGPRIVTLPDGSTLSRADLPSTATRRWVARRKAAVVRGVEYGLLSRQEALDLYDLSDEEFDGWCRVVTRHGEAALKATQIKKYRQLKEECANSIQGVTEG